MTLRRKEIEDKLYTDFSPLVKELGAELLDVQLLHENKVSYLRVAVYHPDGVSLDLCASVQNVLSDRLDSDDPIAGPYTLEVSSPGLERILKREREFSIFAGKKVLVTLFAAKDGKKSFEGTLVGLEKDDVNGAETVVIKNRERTLAFDRTSVGSVRLVYEPRPHREGGREE